MRTGELARVMAEGGRDMASTLETRVDAIGQAMAARTAAISNLLATRADQISATLGARASEINETLEAALTSSPALLDRTCLPDQRNAWKPR